MEPLTVLLVAVATVIAVGFVLAMYRRYWHHRSLRRALEDALAEDLAPGVGTHLDAPVSIHQLAVVDREGERLVYVPVVRVDLDTADAPTMDLIFGYVADVLESIHPLLETVSVHHYDVQFSYGPDGLLVDGECGRVSVPPVLADRLVAEAEYGPKALRADLEELAADGDAVEGATAVKGIENGGSKTTLESAVVWGECCRYETDVTAKSRRPTNAAASDAKTKAGSADRTRSAE